MTAVDLLAESLDAVRRAEGAAYSLDRQMYASPRTSVLDEIEAPGLDPLVFGARAVQGGSGGDGPMRRCERCEAQWSVRAGTRCWCCGKPW